jgi:hypothetical protein
LGRALGAPSCPKLLAQISPASTGNRAKIKRKNNLELRLL